MSITRRDSDVKKKLLFLLFLFLLPLTSQAWFRLGAGSQPSFNDNGGTSRGISVTISSNSATNVYTSNINDREILIQNPNTSFNIFIGTASTLTANSGPRIKIPANSSLVTNNTNSLYAIIESTSGTGSFEILGWVEYDAKDR